MTHQSTILSVSKDSKEFENWGPRTMGPQAALCRLLLRSEDQSLTTGLNAGCIGSNARGATRGQNKKLCETLATWHRHSRCVCFVSLAKTPSRKFSMFFSGLGSTRTQEPKVDLCSAHALCHVASFLGPQAPWGSDSQTL